MKFFTETEDFTHHARFYGIPLYLKCDEEGIPVVAGTNVIFDYLLLFVTWFHNTFVERFAQAWAFLLHADYEPHFSFEVWEMEKTIQD